MLRALKAFLFPDSCLACGEPVGDPLKHLCAACRRDVVPAIRAVELPGPPPGGTPGAPADLAFYALPFRGPSRALVHSLKYGRRMSAAGALVELAWPALRSLPLAGVDVVVAVPLHPARHRERGFNQAALIAAALGETTGAPVVRGLRRVRPTLDQTRLTRGERLANVRAAFVGLPGVLAGARVLLVDDVVTTGATLAEGAAALERAGAASVLCLAIAGRDHAPQGGARPETG